MNKVLRILVFASLLNCPIAAQQPEPDQSVAGNRKVAEIIKSFKGRGVMSDGSAPTPAPEAVKQFAVREGFEIELVASEPQVSQPLFLSWDSRGRMWVVQYRQYQFPAGLKIIRYDQHLRAVFDKVPDPPPHGTRGEDKITVFEDTSGDGIYDKHKDVITGLNIATSVQVGNGGIWVLNPPYLLFYPDADGDDVPDRDPEVHLSGFGMQDTHSVANSLLWGPDGWLYGANGSTTVGSVSSAVNKGLHFQGQCIWRYHPETKVFEIYAEGGGNTFSLDIDSKGRVFAGTNGGGTRGWYFPQGSYSRKSWGKHGPLGNPYAFGFFEHMHHQGDNRRFPQAFCIYEGGLFPKEFEQTIIAPNSLQNVVWHSRMFPAGSTYRTKDEANLIESSDRWFRPVYGGVGPDGAFYMADWYDTRLSHVSPIDDWHKESGRVYRVVPKGATANYGEGNLRDLSSDALIRKFSHSNKWVRRRAMLELGWRGDQSVVDDLAARVEKQNSLEALWALNLMGELTTERAVGWLNHDDQHIRRWVVRLLGDRHESSPGLIKLAEREQQVQVRSQLASTAKRIDASSGLSIVRALLARDEDLKDLHMPLMIWWAVESHAESWMDIEDLLADESLWRQPMVCEFILSRLMQRYAAAGDARNLEFAARLVKLAPDDQSRAELMSGLNQAYQGRRIPTLPTELSIAFDHYQASLGKSGLILALRQGKREAVSEAIKMLSNSATDLGLRIELARALAETRHREAVKLLTQLAIGRGTNEAALQRVAIASVGHFSDASIGRSLVGSLNSSISAEHGLRDTAFRTLASRAAWAKALLMEVDDWKVRKELIPIDVVQQLRTYQDQEIVALVEKIFGKRSSNSSAEKLALMKRLQQLLSHQDGDAEAGRLHYTKRCAICHQLFGEGTKVGPPLDGYERGSLNFWLPAIVEPSLEVREGFQTYLAETLDGRIITGMMAAQDPKTVTLRNAENQLIVLARDDLETLQAMQVSLMPEDVLKDLSDEQIRDLFAYLSLGTKR